MGSGAVQEIIGRGVFAGLGKAKTMALDDTGVSKALAQVYDKMADQIRVWKRPVSVWDGNLGKSIKAPQIMHDLGIAKMMADQRGFAKLDENIGGKQPALKIKPTGDFTPIDKQSGKIQIQNSKDTLRGLIGQDTKGMSAAQVRGRQMNPGQKYVKETNFNRMMEQADKSAGFKSQEEIQSEVEKTARAVSKKVNILDYLRTPDRVLEKIGLKQESDFLKKQYNNYLDELPQEINKVTGWYERVKGNTGAEKRIFQYLDGQNVKLEGEELRVAKEMRQYLTDWADKLGLPEDKRISNYITHIFEKDFIHKEFDEDLAKLISEKIPGSVYDPFLQKRLGKMGYVEDAFRALDAYTKRAVRKYNMDPALERLRGREGDLDLSSWKYVKSLTDRVNMRPTDLDNLLDNFIKGKSVAGYSFGQRPTAAITRRFRQMVYRATLGLNIGSALRNLTQGVNTYAKLGEKNTGISYYKAIKSILSNDSELEKVGVLRDNMIQDRTLSAKKQTIEKLDKGLWVLFDMAEKINRGAAYFGAKSKALAEGKTDQEAIQAGINLARQTQFTFGSVDTPAAL